MNISNNIKVLILFISILYFSPYEIQAQRMAHPASKDSGISTTSKRAVTTKSSNTINGGHLKTTSRTITNKTTTTTRKQTTTSSRRPTTNNSRPPANNTKRPVNNKVTTKSKTNVNINVNINKQYNTYNRRNTRVNNSPVRYQRPPYRYGGYRYYTHTPYHYHPYRPYNWGPAWHPWGYFVTSLATTAILVSLDNQQYYYNQGVYYAPTNGGYAVVQAPIGVTVNTLPKETEIVKVSETTNNYYYGGAFYKKSEEGYTVVPATAGTIVPNLPEGGEEVRIGDITYVQFGDTYYQPIQVDGNDMYEIVEVKDE